MDHIWCQRKSMILISDCGPLTAPANGDINLITTTYGSSATFSCGALYQLNGNPVLTCEAGGTWSSLPPICDNIGIGFLFKNIILVQHSL